jgi:hypothetical protein
MVAMRGHAGVMHRYTGSDATFTIESNGANATIGGVIFSTTISPGYASALKIAIPDEYRPLAGTVMLYQDEAMRIMLSVTDNDAQEGYLVVLNDTAGDLFSHDTGFVACYALRDVYINEQADIRVGADGTLYETAGEAVREQIVAISSEVGDIETALDGILEIQEGLINGSSLPDAAEVTF